MLPAELRKMHELMLQPMGIETEPQSVAEALSAYLDAREALEGRFRVEVPRELEREVLPVVQPRNA
jgi:hypothetical protein